MNILTFVWNNVFWILLVFIILAVIYTLSKDAYDNYVENFCHKCRSKNLRKFITYKSRENGGSSIEVLVLNCHDCGHQTEISKP